MNTRHLFNVAACALLATGLAACGGRREARQDERRAEQTGDQDLYGGEYGTQEGRDQYSHGPGDAPHNVGEDEGEKRTYRKGERGEMAAGGREGDRKTGDDRMVELELDDDIRQKCSQYALPKPKFPFDSAQPKETPEVNNLARCFTEGPLKDANVRLVGRADPRGDSAYNIELGSRRAESIKEILIRQGVPEDRIETASRGERDASEQPGAWDEDRRVDIILVE